MNRVKEGLTAIVDSVSAELHRRKQLTKEQLEKLVDQHYAALKKGIDSSEGQASLKALEEQGLSPIYEECMECKTKLITAWTSQVGLVKKRLIIPAPCPRRADGRHTTKGM